MASTLHRARNHFCPPPNHPRGGQAPRVPSPLFSTAFGNMLRTKGSCFALPFCFMSFVITLSRFLWKANKVMPTDIMALTLRGYALWAFNIFLVSHLATKKIARSLNERWSIAAALYQGLDRITFGSCTNSLPLRAACGGLRRRLGRIFYV